LKLIGRGPECSVLKQLIEALRSGQSRALVIHGEAGVGKTALLDYVAGRASGCRVARAAGVESEMELAFAGLHQLCGPMLDLLDGLPAPQRDALRTAFGISAGPPPDRFLVALAVLSLLSDVADERPLLCLVDDEQWLDLASAQVLAFVARRLVAESVAIVFAARVPSSDLLGMPELVVSGLAKADARALLDGVLTAPLDAQVRDQIVAETHGNPLALVELPRGLTPLEMAGGFGLPDAGRFTGGVEESFRRRLDGLPEQTQRLLLLAAVETAGDSTLVWRAAALLGIDADAAVPAAEADLAELGARVRFRHPLVRSAAYRSATLQDRQRVHRALAEVTDPELDADRRAWHRAHAAPGPDEEVAAELERSAGRAQARGGLAAAAAFLERATMLTLDRAQRARRALAAASAKVDAGDFDAALDLLAIAEVGPLSELENARLDLVQAQLAFVTSRGSDAPPLLMKAAKRLEPIDVNLSRDTYLDAFSATMFAGRLGVGGSAWEVARHAGAAPHAPQEPRPSDLLLDGFAMHYNEGYAAGVPILRRALSAFGVGTSPDEELRWLWLACIAAVHTWDHERWDELSDRHVQLAREVGALSELPLALSSRTYVLLFAGDLSGAAALVEEVQAVKEMTGSSLAPYGGLGLAAFRGSSAEVSMLTETTLGDATIRGEGNAITSVEWASAVLNNGLGEYGKAMAAAERSGGYSGDLGGSVWSPIEVVEAAMRSGMRDVAVDAHRRVHEMAVASGTDWILGLEARSHALISEGETAEHLYGEAIAQLGRTRVKAELARTHLLYGEWLRRERRRTDARVQLRLAHDMLETMGMDAFAERARHELLATGETARKRTPADGVEQLTPQEAQIARLARDGLSNPEIGGRLFLSARTVQYHLRKVFAKLGISSRSQLSNVMTN
jgi:DNA-binding CsgD family transcriptional regulator